MNQSAPLPKVRPFRQLPLTSEQLLLALAVITLISRLIISGWSIGPGEHASFVQAVQHIDIPSDTPRPPGALFQIFFARLLTFITGSALNSLIVINGILSAVAVYAFGKLAARWFDLRSAILAAILFALVPAFFFYGTFASPAIAPIAIAIVAFYFLTHTSQPLQSTGALLFGAIAGFDALIFFFLLPLFVRTLLYLKRRDALPGRRVFGLAMMLIPGLAAWLLTMTMLLGTRELLRYLTPSIDNIFSRTNPAIFFGLSLLTLGVMPFLLLRKHPEENMRPEHKLMRAWIIFPVLVFLFVRTEPQWLLLIVPPVVLSVLNRIRGWVRREGILWGLIALNALLFFVLPVIRPSEDTLMARSRKTSSTFDQFVSLTAGLSTPSFAHIRDISNGESEAVELLQRAHITDTTLVLLESSIKNWTNERALGVLYPHGRIGLYDGHRLNGLLMSDGKDTSMVRLAFNSARAIAIVSKSFARANLDTALIGAPKLGETERLELYELPYPGARKDFVDQLIYLYYQSKHG